MGTFFRSAVAWALVACLGSPAGAQSDRCTHETLSVDGLAVSAAFCVPAAAAAPSVTVTETFKAAGKTIEKSTALAVVAGAQTSRTIDDVDLGPLGSKHTLHMTLAYRGGAVELEHALALPGAIPVK